MGRIVSAAGLQVNPLNLTNLMHLNSHLWVVVVVVVGGREGSEFASQEKPQCEMRQKLPCVSVCAFLFFFPPFLLSSAGGPCRRDIYSKNVFPALNIIDYFLFFGVCF